VCCHGGTWGRSYAGSSGIVITVITLTGDRPIPFDLCKRWMKRQDRTPDQWIIVDDGKIPIDIKDLPVCSCYIRREPKKIDPRYTMIINMKEAIKHVDGDSILIVEDDDYYSQGYVSFFEKGLSKYEVVGIGRSKYYHIPSRGYFIHKSMGHASLASMGFRRSFLPEFKRVLEGDSFLDLRVWRRLSGSHLITKEESVKSLVSRDGRGIVFDDGNENCLYIGMKGLPGRKGIGAGHRSYNSKYNKDTVDYAVLRRWCQDAEVYINLNLERK
jgi:hypothetical protein